MKKFDEKSALVKLWAKNVKNGKKQKEDVPDLKPNFREVVFGLIDAEHKTKGVE